MAVSDPPLQSPVLEGTPNKLSRVWSRFFRDLFVASGGNVGSPFPAGFVSPFMGGAGDVPNGWILADDGTIGSRLSGATNLANDVTRDLYVMLWNTHSDADAPVTGGRGASALIDFAAHKSIKLPLMAGRAIACAGQGSGLTDRDEGATTGTETHTLTSTESGIAAHNHTINITDPGHNHTQNSHNHTQNSHNHTQNSHNHTQNSHTHGAGSYGVPTVNNTAGGASYLWQNSSKVQIADTAVTGTSGSTTAVNNATTATNNATTATNIATTATNNSNTTGITATSDNVAGASASSAHNIMQPTVFLNYIIKL